MPNTLKLELSLKVHLFPPDTHFRDLKHGLVQILYKITFGGKCLVLGNFQQSAPESLIAKEKEERKRRAEGVFRANHTSPPHGTAPVFAQRPARHPSDSDLILWLFYWEMRTVHHFKLKWQLENAEQLAKSWEKMFYINICTYKLAERHGPVPKARIHRALRTEETRSWGRPQRRGRCSRTLPPRGVGRGGPGPALAPRPSREGTS